MAEWGSDPGALVARLRQALLSERDVLGAWLFGSRVTGRPRPDSDVDVGVWMGGVPCGFERRADLTVLLEQTIGLPVDVIVLDRADPLLALDAVNGLPVMTREERRQLEYVLDVAREAEDWRVFLESFLEERRRSREASGT